MKLFGKRNKQRDPPPKTKWVVSYKWNSVDEFELSVCRRDSKGHFNWGPYEEGKIILLEGHVKAHSKETRQRFREYAFVFEDALNAKDT